MGNTGDTDSHADLEGEGYVIRDGKVVLDIKPELFALLRRTIEMSRTSGEQLLLAAMAQRHPELVKDLIAMDLLPDNGLIMWLRFPGRFLPAIKESRQSNAQSRLHEIYLLYLELKNEYSGRHP